MAHGRESQAPSPRPRADGLDIAAAALVRVAPRRWARAIDQARLDARLLVRALVRGDSPPAFATREAPIPTPVPLRSIDPLAEVLPARLSRTYAAVRRDLHVLRRALVDGESPPATVERRRVAPRGAANAVAASAPRVSPLATLRIVSVETPTHDTRTLVLEPTSGAIAFEAGQFLTFHVALPGDAEPVRRAYSLASRPEGRLAITVKRVPGGRVSSFLVDAARVGDVLRAHGPSGAFVLPATSSPRHVLAFAGGSGITPIAEILRRTLGSTPHVRFTLVDANRSTGDIVFAEELRALATRHPDQLVVRHVLEHVATDDSDAALRGRPDRAFVDALVRSEPRLFAARPGETQLALVCGPTPMRESVRGALEAYGLAPEAILEERYLTPLAASAPRVASSVPQTVEVRSGRGRALIEVPPGMTILDAATARGLALPSSCQMGGCGACRVQLVDGEVAMDEPNCLSATERRDRAVLPCIARPLTRTTIALP